jgi:hypothetical protein
MNRTTVPPSLEQRAIVIVFILSMFLGSALLFVVEPMIAKMMLPLLGGTPSVWSTCLVFFQIALLAGYLYADISSKWLARRTQIVVHVVLIVSPFALIGLLPPHLPAGWEPPSETSPIPWVLSTLALSVGLPFFILSSTTPILQRWFSDSGHRDAIDPYFLFAASNAGSLAGLLAYPFVLEPLLRLKVQSVVWTAGYAAFVVGAMACAMLVWGRQATRAVSVEVYVSPEGVTWNQRLRWVALAFVPSSLVLGVTTSLTTDVPAIPMVWVLTLAVYLLSFILVFARHPPIPHDWMVKREPFLILAALMPIISQAKFPFAVMLSLGLLVLFGVAMVCHGEIVRSRPAVRQLTEFYLWIAFGGALGGIFNALVAPAIFRSVLELPLVLVLAAVLRQRDSVATGELSDAWVRRKDWMLPTALGLSMVTVMFVLARLGIRPGRSLNIMIFGYSLVWCLSFAKRRWRFAGGLVALLIASSLYAGPFGHVIHTERSFFGVSRVTTDAHNRFHFLFHGGTTHGIESLDPAQSREPLSYYTVTGPAGQIFHAAESAAPQGDWAIVGLGAGAMACYLQPGQTLTYYEIDPVVVRIARNPSYFRFLAQCAPKSTIILGDARLKLHYAPDAHYGLIVLDAFSGDSIPVHLLTREAVALYLRKLAPRGLLAFHISNIYLDLSQTLAALAQNAHVVCLIEDDTAASQAEINAGKYPSTWVVMARNASDLSVLTSSQTSGGKWLPIAIRGRPNVWTDDYSNLVSSIRWSF